MKNFISFSIVFLMFTLAGCAANHKNLYIQEKNYLERRNIETRLFDTADEKGILEASAQVLQDTGFTIKESETSLGILTAQKNREVGSAAGKTALVFLAALGGKQAQYEDKQLIYVNIITTKMGNSIKARVLFARKTWDNYGNIVKIERITDTKIYQEFFDKLSQSIFLTAHGL